jgi:hypothetical protein
MLTDVLEVRIASIIRAVLEAVRTSETLVNIYLSVWQYIPEDSKLQLFMYLTNSVAPEPEGSSQCSQEPTTASYPDSTGSSLHPPSQSL